MRGGSWCRGRVETERATEGRKRSTLYEYKRVGRKRKSGGGGGCHGETVSGHGAGSDSYLRTSRRIGCPPYNIYKKKKRVFSTEEGGERESEARNRVFLCVSLLGYFGLLLEHQSSRLSVLARVHCIANKTISLAILIDIFFSLFSL